MENKVLFRETQKFRSVILWVCFALVIGSLLYRSIQQIVFDIPFGDKPFSDTGLAMFFIFFGIGFPAFFYFLNLTTEVRNDGIYYKFSPMHIKWQRISFEEIEGCEVKKYRPFREYGGYGIRYTLKGKAYNVSGVMGIQLLLRNGKRVLIGTQEPDKFMDAINKARAL
ncbi:DUF6141 family protein [Alkaliphilus hydrothermalis]|uniref:Bacterial Pleckstrin homology domain-containing protein n=1 Tax=Alkaliphilus hydrothermalis TaxID=1482730 RepID=A0ABS2NSE4_9FIRM|nr:DUF6141 family protein [Alkaliphilus hydrothermalis]MBM7615756.1 hypothetical protein [Alkaliphilus hydrothermalis]